jgi:4-carboxymuconolactone decarboxylase
MDGKDLTAARRNFEAGARTYWHSHSNGQLLMVEQGRMRLQKRSEAVKELGVGGSDYTAPNVVHWHGARRTRRWCRLTSVSAARRNGSKRSATRSIRAK